MTKPLDIFDMLSKKYPDMEFFELYEIRDRIVEKLPNIAKVRETDYSLAEYRKINHILLQKKLEELISVLKEKKYKNIDLVDKVEKIIKNEDLRYYSQYQKYNFCYSDNFHTLFFFYYNEKYISKIKRYKKWTFDREYKINDLLDSIYSKYESKKREAAIYSNIRKFRKSKKHTFIIEIDFYGYRFWSDWTTTGSETIYLIISDVNKEAVINRIVSHEKTKDATSLIVDFAIGDFSQGTIKNISFLPITKENIEKAKLQQKNKKRKYTKRYDKWDCFSDKVHVFREKGFENANI